MAQKSHPKPRPDGRGQQPTPEFVKIALAAAAKARPGEKTCMRVSILLVSVCLMGGLLSACVTQPKHTEWPGYEQRVYDGGVTICRQGDEYVVREVDGFTRTYEEGVLGASWTTLEKWYADGEDHTTKWVLRCHDGKVTSLTGAVGVVG